jgi:hypothetical protein
MADKNLSAHPAATTPLDPADLLYIVQAGDSRKVAYATLLAELGGNEAAMDAIASMFASGTHVGIAFSYNDAGDAMSATVSFAAAADIWTGSSAVKAVTPDAMFDAAIAQALTDAAPTTPDFGLGLNFHWTMGASRTLANPTNMKPGQSGVIIVRQDATGGRIITYGSKWKFPGGAAAGGVLSTAANAVDVIAYYVYDANNIYCTLSKAFA